MAMATEADLLNLIGEADALLIRLRRAAQSALATVSTPKTTVPVRPALVSLHQAAAEVFAQSDLDERQRVRRLQNLIETGKLTAYNFGGQAAQPGQRKGRTGKGNLLVDLNEVW